MWAWLKKWWWVIVGALAAALALVAKLLPRRDNEQLVKQTKADADRIKASAELDLKEHMKKVNKQREELDSVMGIEDKRKRLQGLADLANRNE